LESKGFDIDVIEDALSAADPDWKERELLEWRGAEIMRTEREVTWPDAPPIIERRPSGGQRNP
jgi:hypothetical protein